MSKKPSDNLTNIQSVKWKCPLNQPHILTLRQITFTSKPFSSFCWVSVCFRHFTWISQQWCHWHMVFTLQNYTSKKKKNTPVYFTESSFLLLSLISSSNFHLFKFCSSDFNHFHLLSQCFSLTCQSGCWNWFQVVSFPSSNHSVVIDNGHEVVSSSRSICCIRLPASMLAFCLTGDRTCRYNCIYVVRHA